MLTLVLAAALGTAGFLIAGMPANGATQTNATVSLRTTKLGKILVNSQGHTLYLFMKDRNDKSACTASCATFWPPLISSVKPTAGTGLKASLLGRTKRSDGRMQVTYNKHPLYRFSLDKVAGSTKGEGNFAFGAKWYTVSAKGSAVITAVAAANTSTSPTYTYPTPAP